MPTTRRRNPFLRTFLVVGIAYGVMVQFNQLLSQQNYNLHDDEPSVVLHQTTTTIIKSSISPTTSEMVTESNRKSNKNNNGTTVTEVVHSSRTPQLQLRQQQQHQQFTFRLNWSNLEPLQNPLARQFEHHQRYWCHDNTQNKNN